MAKYERRCIEVLQQTIDQVMSNKSWHLIDLAHKLIACMELSKVYELNNIHNSNKKC